jgi:hypothetical protein
MGTLAVPPSDPFKDHLLAILSLHDAPRAAAAPVPRYSGRARASTRPSRQTAGLKDDVFCNRRGPPVRQGLSQEILTDGCRPSDPLQPSTGDFLFTYLFSVPFAR